MTRGAKFQQQFGQLTRRLKHRSGLPLNEWVRCSGTATVLICLVVQIFKVLTEIFLNKTNVMGVWSIFLQPLGFHHNLRSEPCCMVFVMPLNSLTHTIGWATVWDLRTRAFGVVQIWIRQPVSCHFKIIKRAIRIEKSSDRWIMRIQMFLFASFFDSIYNRQCYQHSTEQLEHGCTAVQIRKWDVLLRTYSWRRRHFSWLNHRITNPSKNRMSTSAAIDTDGMSMDAARTNPVELQLPSFRRTYDGVILTGS